MSTLCVCNFGAKGDGYADDTNAILTAIASGESLTFPNGTYNVQTKKLKPVANTSWIFSGAASLQALPSDQGNCWLIYIDQPGVQIARALLLGERNKHIKLPGEGDYGHGIRIEAGADQLKLSNIDACNMWGDGFYIGGGSRILMSDCRGMNNRRQGLSVTYVSNLVVERCLFSHTSGAAPSDGIDIEPDNRGIVDGVQINDCALLQNDGAGIEIAAKRGTVKNVTIKNATYSGNKGKALKCSSFSWWEGALAAAGLYAPTTYTV